MPIDFEGLPDKAGKSSGIDFSGLPDQAQAAPEKPWYSKAAETLGTPIASMLGFDTSKIDQPTQASSEGVRDPLTGNPLGAEAMGFLRGATEAVTPAWVASALTLGKSGLIPKIASGALAGQGFGEAFDPTLSTSERISGGVQGLAGLLGIKASPAAEASTAVKAAKAEPLIVEPTSQTARLPRIRPITPAGEPSLPTSSPLPQQNAIPYGGSPTGPAPYRSAAKAGVRADLAAEAARLKAAAAEEARQTIQDTIAAGGYEPKIPKISETVSAPAGPGSPAQRMTTSYGPKPEAIDDILGGGAPPELKTPPPAPAPVAGPELAAREPSGPVRSQGAYAYGDIGSRALGGMVPPSEAAGPGAWDDLTKINQARGDVASGAKAAQTATQPKVTPLPIGENESIIDYLKRSGIESIDAGPDDITKAVAPQGAELARFFKTPGGAAGKNYQLAKEAAAAGEIPSAQGARASRLLTIPGREGEGASLMETLGMKPKVVTPEVMPPSSEDWVNSPGIDAYLKATQADADAAAADPLGWGIKRYQQGLEEEAADYAKPVGSSSTVPAPEAAAPDWVSHQSDIVDRLKKLSEESGQMSPGMLRALGGITGSAIGAPVGAYEDEDSPLRGAVLGAGTGGILGAGLIPTSSEENFLKNLLNFRKLSFLSSPMVSAKKALGDVGGQAWESARLAAGQLTGEEPGGIQAGKDLFKELPIFHPVQAAKDFYTGLGDVSAGGPSMYDLQQSAQQGPLGWVGKPISGITNAAVEAMRRGGAPEDTIKAVTGTRLPETEIGRDLQFFLRRHPYLRDYALPFTKMATNIAEGVRNVPGVASFAGDPATAKSRAIIGGLQAALGGASTLYDQSREEEGDPVPTWQKAVRPAAMGVGGVMPFLAGEAATAAATSGPARALLELFRAIPGTQGFLPEPLPNETADNFIKRMIGQNVKTMQPSILSKDWWSEPQAR